MRQMHKQEIGSLRECMETLKILMSERGMNLLATHIGQDVMEFLHEKDQTFNAGMDWFGAYFNFWYFSSFYLSSDAILHGKHIKLNDYFQHKKIAFIQKVLLVRCRS